jgi:putative RecB family exonuclease
LSNSPSDRPDRSGLFSHSRLRAFENCPKQFHFRYVLQIPQATEGIEAFLGKLVHTVLERLYEFARQGMVPTVAQVRRRYELAWEAAYDPERVRIVREGTPVEQYRELGTRCLENYYRRHYPFDREETLGIEARVEFDLAPETPGLYRMQGVIDRIARAPSGTIEIHDYKTGRYVPSQKEVDEDRQLALYQMGVARSYGADQPVELVWHYVARGIERRSVRSPEQLEETRLGTIDLIDRVRAETEFAARKNPLCNWCEFRSLCPAWNPFAPPPAPARRAAPRPAPTDGPRQLSLL